MLMRKSGKQPAEQHHIKYYTPPVPAVPIDAQAEDSVINDYDADAADAAAENASAHAIPMASGCVEKSANEGGLCLVPPSSSSSQ